MKFVPIGITSKELLTGVMDAADFSDDKYEGVQMRKGRQDKAVIIMRSRKASPMEWKVVYGFSSVFFNTLEDAIAFCEEHGMRKLEGGR